MLTTSGYATNEHVCQPPTFLVVHDVMYVVTAQPGFSAHNMFVDVLLFASLPELYISTDMLCVHALISQANREYTLSWGRAVWHIALGITD